jgi:hypothetical protein
MNSIAFVCMVVSGAVLPLMDVVFGKFINVFNDFVVGKLSPSGYRSEVNRFRQVCSVSSLLAMLTPDVVSTSSTYFSANLYSRMRGLFSSTLPPSARPKSFALPSSDRLCARRYLSSMPPQHLCPVRLRQMGISSTMASPKSLDSLYKRCPVLSPPSLLLSLSSGS